MMRNERIAWLVTMSFLLALAAPAAGVVSYANEATGAVKIFYRDYENYAGGADWGNAAGSYGTMTMGAITGSFNNAAEAVQGVNGKGVKFIKSSSGTAKGTFYPAISELNSGVLYTAFDIKLNENTDIPETEAAFLIKINDGTGEANDNAALHAFLGIGRNGTVYGAANGTGWNAAATGTILEPGNTYKIEIVTDIANQDYTYYLDGKQFFTKTCSVSNFKIVSFAVQVSSNIEYFDTFTMMHYPDGAAQNAAISMKAEATETDGKVKVTLTDAELGAGVIIPGLSAEDVAIKADGESENAITVTAVVPGTATGEYEVQYDGRFDAAKTYQISVDDTVKDTIGRGLSSSDAPINIVYSKIFYRDYEDYTGGANWGNAAGSYGTMTMEELTGSFNNAAEAVQGPNGTGLKFVKSSAGTAAAAFSPAISEINSGFLYTAFDIMLNKNTTLPAFYIKLNDGAALHALFAIGADLKVYGAANGTGWNAQPAVGSDGDQKVLESGSVYKVEILTDVKNQTSVYYLDGIEFYRKTCTISDFKLAGFEIRVTDCIDYFDTFTMMYYPDGAPQNASMHASAEMATDRNSLMLSFTDATLGSGLIVPALGTSDISIVDAAGQAQTIASVEKQAATGKYQVILESPLLEWEDYRVTLRENLTDTVRKPLGENIIVVSTKASKTVEFFHNSTRIYDLMNVKPGDTVDVSVKLETDDAGAQGIVQGSQVYIGVYEGEILKNVTVDNVVLDEYGTFDLQRTASIPQGVDMTRTKLKVFIWSNTQKPLYLISEIGPPVTAALLGRIMYHMAFEAADTTDDLNGFSYLSGAHPTIQWTDDEHQNSLYMQGISGFSDAEAFLLLEEPSQEGVWYLSYEVKHQSSGCYSSSAFLGTAIDRAGELTDYLRPFSFTDAGKYGVIKYLNSTGDQTSFDPYLGSQSYDANRWYKVQQWIDFDYGMLYIYIDGREFLKTVLPDYFQELYGVRFLQDKKGKDGSYYDNISFGRLTVDLGYQLKEAGDPMPERYASPVLATFSSDRLGNIFSDRDAAAFKLCMRNLTEQDMDVTCLLKARDEYDNVVWQKEITASLAKDEAREESFVVDMGERKGFFSMQAELKDEENRRGTSETRFSVMHAPEKQNDVWGVCNHFDRNGGKSDEVFQIVRDAGFSIVRIGSTTLQWDKMENIKGVYEMTPAAEMALDVSHNSNMDVMQLMYGKNELYGPDMPPYNDDVLEGFANFCSELVKAAGDRAQYFEVWNEYNHTWTFNLDKRPPAGYIKMLQAVVPKVKAANPNAKIVGYSPSGVGFDWVKDVTELGGLEYCDIVSIHPYSQNMSIEDYGWVGKIQEIKDLFAEHGYPDMPIWASEMGFSSASVGGEDMQAAYGIRMMLLNQYHDLMERVMWYTLQNHQVSTAHEQNFGLIRMWTYEDIPYEAKPVLLAIANYNCIMDGAAPMDALEGDGVTAAYRFRTRDGKQVLVPYSLKGKADWSVRTEAESAEYYDVYGNKQILHAVDGVFHLQVSDNPVYLIANDFGAISPGSSHVQQQSEESGQNEVLLQGAEETGITAETHTITGTPGDSGEIRIRSSLPLRFEYQMSEGLSLDGVEETGEGYAIQFHLGSGGEGDRVRVSAYWDDMLCYDADFQVEYTEGVVATLHLEPYENRTSERWQAVIQIENTSYNTPFSGSLEMKEPAAFAKNYGKIDFGTVEGGETKEIRFTLPELRYTCSLSGECVLSNGKSYEIGGSYKLVTADWAAKAPVIDGKIEEDEWKTDYKIDQSLCEVVIADYGGVEDVSIQDARLQWDQDYFYLSAKVQDNAQSHEIGQERIWAGDSIQFAMAFDNTPNASRTEIGFGLGADGTPKVERTYFMGADAAVDFSGYEVAIGREEEQNVTCYEMKMPWSDILPGHIKPAAGSTLYFSMLLNDNDTGTRRGWVKFGGGIDTVKDPSQFNEIHLLKP